MKQIVILIATLLFALPTLAGKTYTVSSPNHRITATVETSTDLTFAVSLDGKALLKPSLIGMTLADGTIVAEHPTVTSTHKTKIDETIPSPFYRQPSFAFKANTLDLVLDNGFTLRLLASDEGAAYRFLTTREGDITVKDEQALYDFAKTDRLWLAYSTTPDKPFAMAFQNIYHETALDTARTTPAFLPVTVDCGTAKVTVMESDITSYPGMWLQATTVPSAEGGTRNAEGAATTLKATFAPYPQTMAYYPWRHMTHVDKTYDYIARSTGPRAYPWRIFAVAERDIDMPTNHLVYALAPKNAIGDTSWIRPGKSAWDWWGDWNLAGVYFRAGINTDTYRYYIDFAAAHHLQYIILDEGWYDSAKGDILHPVKDLDLPAILAYAKKMNIGVILWAVFNVMDENLEAICSHYAQMGVSGFKVDFMDRNDQTAYEMVERLAACAARHHLVLDLHGIFPPAGLERKYPNILNYESVFGMEEVKWGSLKNDHPRYDVTFPFIRMQLGPVDFTPGAMRNGSQRDWQANYTKPMSQGTRAHQAAEYIVYDAPLEMLCDVPTNYEREPDYTDLLASLPTTFDETRVVDGRLGEYIVTLRRKGNVYYLAGLTNWTPRDLHLDLSFLPRGVYYKGTIVADGVNADRDAEDMRFGTINPVQTVTTVTTTSTARSIKTNTMTNDTTVVAGPTSTKGAVSRTTTVPATFPVHLAPGGGFLLVLAPATR